MSTQLVPQSENGISDLLAQKLGRRSMLKKLGVGAVGVAALGLLRNTALAKFNPYIPVATATLAQVDAQVLNFALNLEYLEAEYYSYAVFGRGIETFNVGVDGVGKSGTTTVKSNPQVPFVTDAIEQYAEEIAVDERNHVTFLRSALGNAKVARPAINLRESFAAAAKAAGLGDGFDPFASEEAFLIGSFVFEDVGVTAYHGAAALINNKDYLTAAAGILAVEAYHASIVRLIMYQLGLQDAAQAISDLRDAAGGSEADQGIVVNGMANIVPTDSNSIAFSRTTRQVLNIVYLAANAKSGGFFPNGLNGSIT
jgi:hypothetical protein